MCGVASMFNWQPLEPVGGLFFSLADSIEAGVGLPRQPPAWLPAWSKNYLAAPSVLPPVGRLFFWLADDIRAAVGARDMGRERPYRQVELLGMASPIPADPPADYRDRYQALTGQSLRECPHCRTGIMVVIGRVARPEICVLVPNSS